MHMSPPTAKPSALARISAATLSRIENGKQVLDSLSQIVALAEAPQIPPSEPTRHPVPAPAPAGR